LLGNCYIRQCFDAALRPIQQVPIVFRFKTRKVLKRVRGVPFCEHVLHFRFDIAYKLSNRLPPNVPLDDAPVNTAVDDSEMPQHSPPDFIDISHAGPIPPQAWAAASWARRTRVV